MAIINTQMQMCLVQNEYDFIECMHRMVKIAYALIDQKYS